MTEKHNNFVNPTFVMKERRRLVPIPGLCQFSIHAWSKQKDGKSTVLFMYFDARKVLSQQPLCRNYMKKANKNPLLIESD